MASLADALRRVRWVLIWDNFEVVVGASTNAGAGTLNPADRELIKSFLLQLQGGRSKIILTSRSSEAWLEKNRVVLAIGGLEGEERWEFCETSIRQLGLQIDRGRPELMELLDLLSGHPLAMRLVLPLLRHHTAAELARVIRTDARQILSGDDALHATLSLACKDLPTDTKQLLAPLALHERFLSRKAFERIAAVGRTRVSSAAVDRFLTTLTTAGLLRETSDTYYELHPALTGFLSSPWRKSARLRIGQQARSVSAGLAWSQGVAVRWRSRRAGVGSRV